MKKRCSKSDSFEPFWVRRGHQVLDVDEFGFDLGDLLGQLVVLGLAVVDQDLELLAVLPVRVVRLPLDVVFVADVADLDELRRVLGVLALSLETAFVDDSAAEGTGEPGVPVGEAVGLARDEALGVFAVLLGVAELVEDGRVW